MTKYFADVSSYQRDDLAFFQSFVNAGVTGMIIKATEGSATGTAYVNTKLLNQTRNALKAGLNVGFYHYLLATSNADAIEEAKFFESKVKELGFGTDTPLICDVEDSSLNTAQVANYVTAFINYLQGQGYTNVIQYSYGSWFWNGVLNANSHKTWVANYGVNVVGVSGNVVAWQYTNKWGGGDQDMSFDWGVFDNVKQPVEQAVQKSTIINVVTASSKGVSGFTTYNSTGIADKDTNISPKSMWLSSGILVLNKKAYFKIATDIYLPQESTILKSLLVINYIDGYGVNAYDKEGNAITDSNLKFKTGTKWKVADTLTEIPNIGWCYQVAANEYVPIKYQQGSGYSGKD